MVCDRDDLADAPTQAEQTLCTQESFLLTSRSYCLACTRENQIADAIQMPWLRTLRHSSISPSERMLYSVGMHIRILFETIQYIQWVPFTQPSLYGIKNLSVLSQGLEATFVSSKRQLLNQPNTQMVYLSLKWTLTDWYGLPAILANTPYSRIKTLCVRCQSHNTKQSTVYELVLNMIVVRKLLIDMMNI